MIRIGGARYTGSWPGMEVIPPRAITHLAFRTRFTDAEQVTIELAAAHDPGAATEQQQLAASLRASLANINAAKFVDLDDARTVAGVIALESYGILDAGRSEAILFSDIDPQERYA